MSDDNVGATAVVVVVAAVLCALCFALSGCTLTHDGTSLSVFQLGPGDDVQTRTTTLVGVELSPFGTDATQLRLGYIRTQQTRVPAYDDTTTMPYVKVQTSVNAAGTVLESLEVNDEAPIRGLFSSN